MPLRYNDYELPLLATLERLDGGVKTHDVYPLVEKRMSDILEKHPEEYDIYPNGSIIWKNRT